MAAYPSKLTGINTLVAYRGGNEPCGKGTERLVTSEVQIEQNPLTFGNTVFLFTVTVCGIDFPFLSMWILWRSAAKTREWMSDSGRLVESQASDCEGREARPSSARLRITAGLNMYGLQPGRRVHNSDIH